MCLFVRAVWYNEKYPHAGAVTVQALYIDTALREVPLYEGQAEYVALDVPLSRLVIYGHITTDIYIKAS